MRDKLEIDLDEILDLVACAQDYGYDDDVLMQGLFQMCGKVTDEEIDFFADSFLSNEMMAKGYSVEDRDEIHGRLTDWRDKWEAA